jgi:hypothetical protein
MNRKLTYIEVKKFFVEKGFELLEKEYISNSVLMKCKCSNGHEFKISRGKLHSGRRCPECSGKKKKTIEFIKKEFNKVDYIVTDTEYKNSRTPINFICDKGHKAKLNWDNFKYGQRCGLCAINKKKTYNEVVEEFTEKGFTVLSKKYENVNTPLQVRCSNGHTLEKTRMSLISGNGCRICSCKERRTIEYVSDKFKEEGYILLTKEYVHGKQPLDFICSNGHKHIINWNNFSNGQRCMYCTSGSISPVSQEWLDKLGNKNIIREKSFIIGYKRIRVDGFDPETNTVYEFLGDYWHGNPRIYNRDVINGFGKKTFGQLYDETLKRFSILFNEGFIIKFVWECDYRSGNIFSDNL